MMRESMFHRYSKLGEKQSIINVNQGELRVMMQMLFAYFELISRRKRWNNKMNNATLEEHNLYCWPSFLIEIN